MHVVIRCPKTGKDVRTGISADPESFKSLTVTNNSVSCPHCYEIHTWNKEDARLSE